MEQKIESKQFENHPNIKVPVIEILKDHGIELICPVKLADKSEVGEIRIHSQIQATYKADEKKAIHQDIYQDAFDSGETFFNRFHELNSHLFYSYSIYIDSESEIKDLNQLEKIHMGTMDAGAAIDNGYVLRLFYSDPKDCVEDLDNLFRYIDENLSYGAMLGYLFDLTEVEEVEESEIPF